MTYLLSPTAPHFGGLWENTAKLLKRHFRRMIGDSLFMRSVEHVYCRSRGVFKFKANYLTFFRS